MVGVYLPVYVRGTMVGVYLPVYMQGVPCRVYTTLCICLLPHPGYTHHPTLLLAVPALRIAELRCRLTEPWALGRRNPWVRGREGLPVLKGVRDGGRLCAELLRFSREDRRKDRIDLGGFPVYSP